jgi:hypothetical protein
LSASTWPTAGARGAGSRPAARAWRQLALLALCALLLAAQQQWRAHALAHLGDAHAAVAAVPDAHPDHGSGHEAAACALCMAAAAAATLMPAGPAPAVQRARPWWAKAEVPATAERRAGAAARFIRGPPLPPRLG